MLWPFGHFHIVRMPLIKVDPEKQEQKRAMRNKSCKANQTKINEVKSKCIPVVALDREFLKEPLFRTSPSLTSSTRRLDSDIG